MYIDRTGIAMCLFKVQWNKKKRARKHGCASVDVSAGGYWGLYQTAQWWR